MTAAGPGDAQDAPAGVLVVLAGPSGVGKGAVVQGLQAARDDVALSVSATTRAPRPGEVDGVHYRFVSRDDFQAMVDDDELLEWAEYVGNRYGTPAAQVDELLARGRVVLLEIEVQGADQVRRRRPDALLVFLAPPSLVELDRRLRGRGTEDPDRIARRLEIAERELAAADRFDVVVVNDDLDDCVAAVSGLVDAHRSRGADVVG